MTETTLLPSPHEAIIYLALVRRDHAAVKPEEMNPIWFGRGNYFDKWRKMFAAVEEWNQAGLPPDMAAFEAKTKFPNLSQLLERCVLAGVSPESWPTYVATLQKQHATQAFEDVVQHVMTAKEQPGVAVYADILKGFARQLEEAEAPLPVELKSPKDFSNTFLERMAERAKREGPEMRFGFPEIDSRFNGLCRGRIYTIAARTGIGKSVFCLNVASNLISQGKRVLYFSTEMDITDKWARFMAIRTGIWSSHFNQGRFQDGEMQKIQEEAGRLYESDSFHVCDLSSPNISQIRSAVEKARPDVVILDYIGLFDFGSRAANRTQEIGHFMKKVKHLGRQANAAIIVVSQLNRGAEFNPSTGSSRTPQISDIRDCGEIEQDSDGIILLYMKPGMSKEEVQMMDVLPVYAEIGKNRHGGQGRFMLDFEKYVLRMKESGRSPETQ